MINGAITLAASLQLTSSAAWPTDDVVLHKQSELTAPTCQQSGQARCTYKAVFDFERPVLPTLGHIVQVECVRVGIYEPAKAVPAARTVQSPDQMTI
jgi:hypothetical protein